MRSEHLLVEQIDYNLLFRWFPLSNGTFDRGFQNYQLTQFNKLGTNG